MLKGSSRIVTTSTSVTPIGSAKLSAQLHLTEKRTNSYLGARNCAFNFLLRMFKRLKELYKEYKPYVRVDLIMYAVLILLIIGYFLVETLVND